MDRPECDPRNVYRRLHPYSTKLTHSIRFDSFGTFFAWHNAADHTLFNRFDRFNAKYNPAGNSSLRTIFLKAENEIEGKYFAELTKIALSRLESTKTCFAEYRMSVYGAAKDDWTKVAKWTYDSNLCDHPNNKWMVQLPRIYRIFKKIGKVANFGQTMENFFAPLFEATNNPEADPKLAKLLENLSGFDSVDDER